MKAKAKSSPAKAKASAKPPPRKRKSCDADAESSAPSSIDDTHGKGKDSDGDEAKQPQFMMPDVHCVEAPTTLEAGPQKPENYIGFVLKTCFNRLDFDQRLRLHFFLQSWTETLKFGTMCAGSEAPTLVLMELAQQLKSEIGVRLALEHCFAAELDAEKRRFIASTFPEVRAIFSAVQDLQHDRALSYKTGKPVVRDIEAVKLVFAGFPCTDVSSLNIHRGSATRIVEEAGGKTGSCFAGIHAYLRKHKDTVDIVVLENVTGLHRLKKGETGPTNLARCCELLDSIGFCSFAVQCDPRCFGSPQSRARLWIPCVRKDFVASLKITQERFQDLVCGFLDTFSGMPCMTLENLLLSDDDPLVISHLRSARARAGKHIENEEGLMQEPEDSTWHETHRKHCSAKGKEWDCRDWISTASEAIDDFPGVGMLTPREVDSLLCHDISFPDESLRLINVAPHIDRVRVQTEILECVTPRQRVWLSDRCRLLLGLESLFAQGIHYGSKDAVVRDFPDRLLADLAGNAFHTGTCACVVLSVLCALAEGEVKSAEGAQTEAATVGRSAFAEIWRA